MKETFESIQKKRKERRHRKDKWESMWAWETDEDGNYAANEPVVDPVLIGFGGFPIIGIASGIGSLFSARDIGQTWTGIGQKAMRSAHITLVYQLLVLCLMFLMA